MSTKTLVDPRKQQILQAIWRQTRLSQSQIHRLLGIRKNTVSEDVAELLAARLIRAADAQPLERGRPLTPLEIDPQRRDVLGLSIQSGRVEVARLNLLGELQEKPVQRSVSSLRGLIRTARELLKHHATKQTLALGAATPGILDGTRREILFSAIDPNARVVSLNPLFESLDLPVIVENDVHAMAAQWLLVNRASDEETVLLVFLDDGQLGAALLVEGHPVPGCVIGAHELGHTRLNVKTKRCYCGEVGCLERVFSSDFLGSKRTLTDLAEAYSGDRAITRMLQLTGIGLANAVNLLRPHRVVLVGGLVRFQPFIGTLIESMRSKMLAGLVKHVQVGLWEQSQARSAETAAWLALAGLYHKGWTG